LIGRRPTRQTGRSSRIVLQGFRLGIYLWWHCVGAPIAWLNGTAPGSSLFRPARTRQAPGSGGESVYVRPWHLRPSQTTSYPTLINPIDRNYQLGSVKMPNSPAM
jgi:hypothetical protein